VSPSDFHILREIGPVVSVGLLGAVIGFGQLLASGDDMKVRHAFGRAIVSAGIAMSAFSVLAWFPEAKPAMLIGIACLLASLGTSGLTMMAKRFFPSNSSANDSVTKD
jgi:hypothetical protein